MNKRLIFTVATGRCGTKYLAMVLRAIPGVSSHHEPRPDFAEVMRAVQTNSDLAHRFWIEQKLPVIERQKAPVYIETSHVFCKGFFEPLLALGYTPDVIVLTRSLRQVALSFCRIGSIPGRTKNGLKYLLSPDDPGVLRVPLWQDWDDYQLCYWYCLEIHRRAQEIEQKVLERRGRVVHTSTDVVSTVAGFRRLLKALDLPNPGLAGWAKYFRYGKRRINIQTERKSTVVLSDALESLEQRVIEQVRQYNPDFSVPWSQLACVCASGREAVQIRVVQDAASTQR